MTSAESGNCWKSILSWQPHPVKVEMVENQSFQDYHNLSKCKVSKISLYETITSSKSGNSWKSVLSGPPHPLNVELSDSSPFKKPHPQVRAVWNLSFYDYHILWKWKLKINPFKTTRSYPGGNGWKSVLSSLPYPFKVQSVQNQSLQNYHILQKCKCFKISPFRTTALSQTGNCLMPVLSRPPHPPKVEIVENQSIEDPPSAKSRVYPKSVFSRHHTLSK